MRKNIKKILIVMGAFKDVFTPKESCEMIKRVIEKNKNLNFIPEIECITIADGGEYSTYVVHESVSSKKNSVNKVVNAYKQEVNADYLMLDNETAFIGSSDILRIPPDLDEMKNPLELTSYGLGQLIKDSVSQGARKVIVGLGGTNTVDGGVGMAQAIGVRFLDDNYLDILPADRRYYSGKDLKYIKNIFIDKELVNKFKDIDVETLCDGTISIDEMYIPNNQKIGSTYDNIRSDINNDLQYNIGHYSDVVDCFIKDRSGRLMTESTIKGEEYYGVAGGINLSLEAIFNARFKSGSEYFISILDVENKINGADLIITGEGRIDNSLTGKAPVAVSKAAKKYGKPVLYLTGDVSESLEKYFDNEISLELPQAYLDSGITAIISCHLFYKNKTIPSDPLEAKIIFRKNTPIIFEKAISDYFYMREYLK
jgi:glycerate 2-kinase